jgi:hypothetical protein
VVQQRVGGVFDYGSALQQLEALRQAARQQRAAGRPGSSSGSAGAVLPPLAQFYEREDGWRDPALFAQVGGG